MWGAHAAPSLLLWGCRALSSAASFATRWGLPSLTARQSAGRVSCCPAPAGGNVSGSPQGWQPGRGWQPWWRGLCAVIQSRAVSSGHPSEGAQGPYCCSLVHPEQRLQRVWGSWTAAVPSWSWQGKVLEAFAGVLPFGVSAGPCAGSSSLSSHCRPAQSRRGSAASVWRDWTVKAPSKPWCCQHGEIAGSMGAAPRYMLGWLSALRSQDHYTPLKSGPSIGWISPPMTVGQRADHGTAQRSKLHSPGWFSDPSYLPLF